MCAGVMVNRCMVGRVVLEVRCGGEERGGGSLRPVSVIPNTGSLLFLNPSMLVAMTTML